LEVDLKNQESFNTVSLVEPVGQWDNYAESRIRNYRFEYWNGENWIRLTGGETPTRTPIGRVPRVSAQKVRLLFESSRRTPHIAEIGVYDEPG
jgi:alpha-L-fucosidase